MYFSEDVTSWIDLIDDGNAMLSRLKTLEYLLFNCAMDLPLAGCKFAGTTKDGYDGSEMLFFIDETLEHLIREYESQVAKYQTLLENNRKGNQNNIHTVGSPPRCKMRRKIHGGIAALRLLIEDVHINTPIDRRGAHHEIPEIET